jgi:hypothetical protein
VRQLRQSRIGTVRTGATRAPGAEGVDRREVKPEAPVSRRRGLLAVPRRAEILRPVNLSSGPTRLI